MEGLELVFDPLPGEAPTRLVIDNLHAHNIAATGISTWYPVGFFLKSGRGEWLGGLMGDLWGGWLYIIRILWVASPGRGCGNGTRLRQAAEEYAVERFIPQQRHALRDAIDADDVTFRLAALQHLSGTVAGGIQQ